MSLSRIGDLSERLTVPTWLEILLHAAGAAVVLAYLNFFLGVIPWENDAWGFYIAWEGGLYDISWLDRYAYVYSPAFAQAIAPFGGLDWEVYRFGWIVIQMIALLLLAGPFWSGLILLLPWPSIYDYPNAVVATIGNGNPQLLLALAIAAGLRWPAAWALPLLTKVTPGVGILWFAFRREWRRLGIALGATAAIALVSFAFGPGLWVEWVGLLGEATAADAIRKEPILALPLLVRGPLALLLLGWGALTNRYWTVPIASMLALPAIQLGGFALAVAAIPFLRIPLAPRWPLPRGEDSGTPSHLPRRQIPEGVPSG